MAHPPRGVVLLDLALFGQHQVHEGLPKLARQVAQLHVLAALPDHMPVRTLWWVDDGGWLVG